jgi:hypothetical protein
MGYEVVPNPQSRTRWTGLLIECARVKVGSRFTLEIAADLIPRFRAMLRVSKRTNRWRWSVKKIYRADHSIIWAVTKVGRWPSKLK